MVSEKLCVSMLMRLQYEQLWLKGQRSTLTFETFIAIVSLGLRYQERIMALASTGFKKSTFKIFSHLNALGSKFDLEVK